MNPQQVTVVFIGGHEHSGSTILDLYLQQHPQVVSVGEAAKLDRYTADPSCPCACGRPFGDCPFWLGVAREAVELGRPLDALDLSSADDTEYVRSSEILFEAVARASGCSTIVDSSKGIRRFRKLRAQTQVRLLPVHLTRDLYGYLASHKKRTDIGARDALRLVRRYLWLNRQYRQQLRDLPHVSVRFEDLVADRRAAVDAIYRLAGLDPDLAPPDLEPGRTVHNLAGNRLLRRVREPLSAPRARTSTRLFPPVRDGVARVLSRAVDLTMRGATDLGVESWH